MSTSWDPMINIKTGEVFHPTIDIVFMDISAPMNQNNLLFKFQGAVGAKEKYLIVASLDWFG